MGLDTLSDMAKQPAKPNKPGDGFLGWLGRQVGHVKKAIKTDVQKGAKPKPAGTAAPAPKQASPQPQPPRENASPTSPASSGAPRVVYREDKVEEADIPDQPGVKLRRTTIDEVVVDESERAG